MMYDSLHGVVLHNKQPIPFSEISGLHRRFTAENQTKTLQNVHRALEPNVAFIDWLQKIVADKNYRITMTQKDKTLR